MRDRLTNSQNSFYTTQQFIRSATTSQLFIQWNSKRGMGKMLSSDFTVNFAGISTMFHFPPAQWAGGTVSTLRSVSWGFDPQPGQTYDCKNGTIASPLGTCYWGVGIGGLDKMLRQAPLSQHTLKTNKLKINVNNHVCTKNGQLKRDKTSNKKQQKLNWGQIKGYISHLSVSDKLWLLPSCDVVT